MAGAGEIPRNICAIDALRAEVVTAWQVCDNCSVLPRLSPAGGVDSQARLPHKRPNVS